MCFFLIQMYLPGKLSSHLEHGRPAIRLVDSAYVTKM